MRLTATQTLVKDYQLIFVRQTLKEVTIMTINKKNKCSITGLCYFSEPQSENKRKRKAKEMKGDTNIVGALEHSPQTFGKIT